MKYRVIYDAAAARAAEEYCNTNNKGLIVPVNVKDRIESLARQNAKYWYEDQSEQGRWVSYTCSGGLTILASLFGTTKKGHPIINIDILVSPMFGSSNAEEFKYELSH